MEEINRLGYVNLTLFAVGGEGKVYTCEKQETKYIAKVVDALEDEQAQMLTRVNKLRNEYFPHIVEMISEGDKTIIIREFIEGTTLAEEIKKNGSFSYSRAKEILFDICGALRVLHSMKPHPIIYRDLKPDNAIITSEGKMKLIDFGIARYHKQDSTRDTVLAGTKGYTAPEVMAGMQSDVRSDVYSIGLVFYEMLSGKSLQDPPYQIRPVAENNEFLPEYVDEIITKATDFNQINRYANIDEFVYELENIKEIKAKQKKKKRRRRLITVLVLAMLIVAAVVWIVLPMLDDEKTKTLLELDFDHESELSYLSGDDLEIRDGNLHILGGWCDIDYGADSGTIVHYRVQLPQKDAGEDSMVTLCQQRSSSQSTDYRVHGTCEFQFIHTDGETSVSSGYQKMSGSPVANMGQMLDIILYTTEDNSAVYALIYDSQTENLAYTAYQVPDYVDDEKYRIGVMTEKQGADGEIVVDFLRLSEGSLQQYLSEYIAAYEKNKEKVDAFITNGINELPQVDQTPLEGAETVLDLQFDEAEDAGWLELRGPNAESMIAQDFVSDGVFLLEQEALLKYTLEPGQLIHIRTKAPEIPLSGSMYMIDLGAGDYYGNWSDQNVWFRFYVSNNQPFLVDVQMTDSYANLSFGNAAMLARSGARVDLVIWIDSDHSIRYIVSNPDSPDEIAYTGVALDEQYISDGWMCSLMTDTNVWNGEYTDKDLQTDVEFIRVATGSISAYLTDNIPAYTTQQARVDAFLAQPMSLVSELEFMQHEENSEEESPAPSDETDT